MRAMLFLLLLSCLISCSQGTDCTVHFVSCYKYQGGSYSPVTACDTVFHFNLYSEFQDSAWVNDEGQTQYTVNTDDGELEFTNGVLTAYYENITGITWLTKRH